jgi:hypothetical protein
MLSLRPPRLSGTVSRRGEVGVSPYLLKDSASKDTVKRWLTEALRRYQARSGLKFRDEDVLTESFFSAISTKLNQLQTAAGRLEIDAYKIRGRGPGADEKPIGADGIGLVHVDTASTFLSGFFLFQAKKVFARWDTLKHSVAQCRRMLSHTPASYLLALLPQEVNLVSAMAIVSVRGGDPSLRDVPFVSFPRFFVEHLLHGLMLEPLDKPKATVPPEVAREIRYVVTVVVIGDRGDRARVPAVDEFFADLDLEPELIEPDADAPE